MPKDKLANFDFTKVKVKQEKLSPPPAPKFPKHPDEVINEIIPKLFGTPPRKDAGADDDKNSDEKKSIEPVKSSNEILAELFKVFNAAPPQTLLNDEYLLQKKKKRKKDKKHKKKSKSRGSKSSSDKDDESIKSGGGASDKDSTVSDGDRLRKKQKKKKKKKSSGKHDVSEDDEEKHSEKKASDHQKSDSPEKYDIVISEDDENYSKSPTQSSRHITIEDSPVDDVPQHYHRHHHHRHHYHHKEDEQDLKQQQQQQQHQQKQPIGLNSRKIIIKSVKDSKIFKDTEEKQKELPKHPKKHRHHDRDHEKSSDRNGDKDREREGSSSHRRDSKRESSEISLSDEETYLKEKEMSFYRSSDPYYGDRRSRNHSYYNDRSSRSHYRDTSRERSRSHYQRNRWRSRSRSRSRYRGRSRSRSTELVIDKKRLLEIARKNAISMFKNGSLPGTQGMSEEVKDKVLMRMRYGGKSVEELTEFCKKLSQGENLNDLSDLSSNEEDSDHDKYGNEKAFHHPFVLKDRGPIVMNIKNATQIPPKTAEQTKAILMQYPVSSGQQHRLTENEWVPVSPKRSDPPPPPPPMQVVPSKPQPPKNVFQKPLPLNEEQQPAFVPTQPVITTSNGGITTPPSTITVTTVIAIPTATTITTTIPTPIAMPVPVPVPATTPAPMPVLTTSIPKVQPPSPLPPSLPPAAVTTVTPTGESIFPEQNKSIDVSTVIAKRLNAMRKLQENPTDPEALKMMYDAQKNMSAWASSKYTPGQFTGSTGANILTAKELTSGYQAWAKRDQLTSTTPVSGGMGMHLLQKMGWKPGEGLGKTKSGALQPLLLDVKMDKRGLVATEEDPTIPKLKRKKQNPVTEAQKSLEQKHPVSLLDEISAKRKWGPPVYDVVSDEGPSHRKSFVFKVVVNGVMYQPTIPCRTKKEAKALAAKYCLQQLGILGC